MMKLWPHLFTTAIGRRTGSDIQRLRLVAGAVTLAIGVIGCASPPVQHSPSKLDRALTEWSAERTSGSARVLIQTTSGAADAVMARLQPVADSVTASSSPDLLVARLSPEGLRAAIGDRDVARISSDAPVQGLASKRTRTSTSTETTTSTETVSPRKTKSSTETTAETDTLALDTTDTRDTATSWVGNSELLRTLALIDSTGSRTTAYRGDGVGVAIIDSGLEGNNSALQRVAFYDCVDGCAQAKKFDHYGHGTHVAGLVASYELNPDGSNRGIAPHASLFVLQVLDANGNGYTSDVIEAINFASANKATLNIGVINLSLGHPIYEPAATDPLVQAVENAVAHGVVVVVSAGNFGGDPATHTPAYAGITSPGNAPGAITVGAVDTDQTATRGDDAVAWFSSRGPTWHDGYQKPDVVAPGSPCA